VCLGAFPVCAECGIYIGIIELKVSPAATFDELCGAVFKFLDNLVLVLLDGPLSEVIHE